MRMNLLKASWFVKRASASSSAFLFRLVWSAFTRKAQSHDQGLEKDLVLCNTFVSPNENLLRARATAP